MTAQEGRLRMVGHRGYPPALMARFDASPLTSDTLAVHVLTTGVPSFFATFADLNSYLTWNGCRLHGGLRDHV